MVTTKKVVELEPVNYLFGFGIVVLILGNINIFSNIQSCKANVISAAAGEMGVCTAHSITHALRRCIHESRMDSGYDSTSWEKIG